MRIITLFESLAKAATSAGTYAMSFINGDKFSKVILPALHGFPLNLLCFLLSCKLTWEDLQSKSHCCWAAEAVARWRVNESASQPTKRKSRGAPWACRQSSCWKSPEVGLERLQAFSELPGLPIQSEANIPRLALKGFPQPWTRNFLCSKIVPVPMQHH